MDFLVPIIIGLVVGVITLFILISQLRTVKKQNAAAEYVNKGSMKISHQFDHYLSRKVEREAIQRQTQQN